MILSLHAQAQLFLLTVFLGGGMGLFYDGLRVFRHALRHNAFWVQAEDGLFWLLAVFLVFCVMLHANAGEIRFFTILGLFGGMGLYFLTLSRMVLAVSDKIISAVKYMLGLFGRIVTTPFRLLWLVFCRPARKIGGFCEKQRKKLLQSVKLCVKIIIHRLHINRRDAAQKIGTRRSFLWGRKKRNKKSKKISGVFLRVFVTVLLLRLRRHRRRRRGIRRSRMKRPLLRRR